MYDMGHMDCIHSRRALCAIDEANMVLSSNFSASSTVSSKTIIGSQVGNRQLGQSCYIGIVSTVSTVCTALPPAFLLQLLRTNYHEAYYYIYDST